MLHSQGGDGEIEAPGQGRGHSGGSGDCQGGVSPFRPGNAGGGAHARRGAREAWRRGHGGDGTGAEPVADGAPDAEHHAAHERHCHHDAQVCGAAEGHEDPGVGHPQDHAGHADAGEGGHPL